MFEFLFKLPWTAFEKGHLVLARPWPVWLLAALLLVTAGGVAWLLLRRRELSGTRGRGLVLGLMQWLPVALLLLLLWQPALSVSTLEAHQNAIAVVVDASRSMAIDDENSTRLQSAKKVLDSGLLDELKRKYTVVLYQAGASLERVDRLEQIQPTQPATRLGAVLKQVSAETGTLPLGGVILLSDGADNSGGVEKDAIQALRAARLPVYTVGFGKTELSHDVEITGAQAPARALPGSRVNIVATIRQQGFAGKPARLEVKDGAKVLGAKTVTLPSDGQVVRDSVVVPAGEAGALTLNVSVTPLDGEINPNNNAITRIVRVERRKPRILYFEGEPRWEYKFIRRAAEEDQHLDLVSMLRTTQNKIYRQGIRDAKELEDGYPVSVEDLFSYDALIIGTVEAAAFTPAQLSLIREFADRRGGGVLFLGGRVSLSEGGWPRTPVAEMLPVALPDRKGTFRREEAKVALSAAAGEHPITRLEEDPQKNASRWAAMPAVADFQEVGAPKPAALPLLEIQAPGRGRLPLLVVQNYGRGRVGVMATGGSWRWQMMQDSKDLTHEAFWQQMLRWLVADTPGHVRGDLANNILMDGGEVELRAEARDRNYLPAADAVMEARILGPDGLTDRVVLQPDPTAPGWASAKWAAPVPGSFLAEIVARRGDEEVGRAEATFLREDGKAEAFRAQQDRQVLEQIAGQTGGRYFEPRNASEIAGAISFSEAGIARTELVDLWDAPFFFLLLVLAKAAEWLVRRRWGAV